MRFRAEFLSLLSRSNAWMCRLATVRLRELVSGMASKTARNPGFVILGGVMQIVMGYFKTAV